MAIGQAGVGRVATGFSTGSEYTGLFNGDVEVTGGGYARRAVGFQQSTEQGTENSIVNSAAIDFGTATAAWGTVNRVKIFDNATATADANLLYEAIITPRTISSGDSVTIPVNGFPIQIS